MIDELPPLPPLPPLTDVNEELILNEDEVTYSQTSNNNTNGSELTLATTYQAPKKKNRKIVIFGLNDFSSHENSSEFQRFIAHQDFGLFILLASKVKIIRNNLICGTTPSASDVISVTYAETRKCKDEANEIAKFIQTTLLLGPNVNINIDSVIIPKGTFLKTDLLIKESIISLSKEFNRCMTWYNALKEASPPVSPPKKRIKINDSIKESKKKETGKGKPIAVKYSKRQTDILTSWMIAHIRHPFPNAVQIEELSKAATLSRSQIVNWTTNVRKRNLKATIEGGKKPHHFLDFLFMAVHRERQQMLNKGQSSMGPVAKQNPRKQKPKKPRKQKPKKQKSDEQKSDEQKLKKQRPNKQKPREQKESKQKPTKQNKEVKKAASKKKKPVGKSRYAEGKAKKSEATKAVTSVRKPKAATSKAVDSVTNPMASVTNPMTSFANPMASVTNPGNSGYSNVQLQHGSFFQSATPSDMMMYHYNTPLGNFPFNNLPSIQPGFIPYFLPRPYMATREITPPKLEDSVPNPEEPLKKEAVNSNLDEDDMSPIPLSEINKLDMRMAMDIDNQGDAEMKVLNEFTQEGLVKTPPRSDIDDIFWSMELESDVSMKDVFGDSNSEAISMDVSEAKAEDSLTEADMLELFNGDDVDLDMLNLDF